MVALVVAITAALCAAVALGSPEIKHNFYSPIPDSPEIEQDFYSPLLDRGRPSKEETRIVDGEPACPDQFRHHARILTDDRWSTGGSLIKPTAILTRGTVVHGYKKFTIRLGSIFRYPNDSVFIVESIWGLVHPEYNTEGNFNNDVAVILLNVEVPLGKSIWPVKLPSFDEVNESFTGQRALISGFGKVNTTDSIYQQRLRFTEVTVISNDLCKKFIREDHVLDTTLCAGNAKTAICVGDHGGALVIKTRGQYKQIGIASFQGSYCGAEVPSAYTRVTSYLEWIQRAAGNLDDWGDNLDYWGVAENSYCN